MNLSKLFTTLVAFFPLITASPTTPVPSILDKRDDPIFRIGYADCSWVVCGGGGQCNVDVVEYWMFQKGTGDITCSSFNNLNQYGGLINGQKTFAADVCGSRTDFYYKNGNWDFYKAGGDGTLLGTCYPENDSLGFCAINGFSACYVKRDYYCLRSYMGTPPCV